MCLRDMHALMIGRLSGLVFVGEKVLRDPFLNNFQKNEHQPGMDLASMPPCWADTSRSSFNCVHALNLVLSHKLCGFASPT